MPDFSPTPQEPTWGDTLDLFQAGAWSVGSSLAGLARSNADNPAYGSRMKEFQLYFNQKRDANTGEITEAGRAQAFSDFGSEEFWKSPVGWSVAQLAGASPYILATVVPVAATGGLSGIAAGALTAGALTAGDVTSGVQETVDRMSDEELSEKSLGFADDILSGKSSEEARNNLINTMLGHKQAMAFALGVGSGFVGIPRIAGGAIGRILGRETAKIPQATGGFLKGGLKEGGVGAASEYVEEAGADILGQTAQIAGGFQDEIDFAQAHRRGMTGAVVGGMVGTPLGAMERAGKGGEKRTAHTAIPSTAPPPASIQAATEPASGAQPGFPARLRSSIPQPGFPTELVGTPGAPPVTPPGAGITPPPQQPAGAIPTLRSNTLPADPEARIPGTALALRGSTEPTILPDPLSPAGDVQLALAAKAPPAIPPPSRAMGAIPEARVPSQQPVTPPSAVPPQAPVPPANVPPPGAIPTPETRTPEQVMPTVPPLRPNVPPMQPVPPPQQRPMQPVPPPQQRPMQPVPPPAARPMQPVPPANVPPPGQMPSRQLVTIPRRPIGPTPVRPTPDVIPMRPSPYAAVPDIIALPPPSDRATPQGPIALPPPPVRRAPVVRRPEPKPTKKTGRILETKHMTPAEEAVFERALEDYERGGSGLVTTALVDYAMKRDFIARVKRKKAGEPAEEPMREAAPITAEERKALGMEHTRTGKKSPVVKAKIKADEEKAQELLDRYAPDLKAKVETKQQLQARVKTILDDAKNVKIPDRIMDVHSDALVWLTEAKKLNQAFNTRKRSIDAQIQSFLFRERAFKSGMGEEARAERKQEAAQEREPVGSGTETVASAPMPSEAEITRREIAMEIGEEVEPEEDTVVLTKPKTSRGTARPNTFESTEKASPVRKVEITPELRAKYEMLPSKVTPKIEAIVAKTKTAKERLASALERIDRVRAGAVNARTGLFNIHGMQLAIQYAKGMVRRGTTPEGQTWQQRMPAHYGHIKGTKGADGQPIDIYIGPNPDADTVFVVDQRNPATGEFDEHKVMLGFKDADAALTTYHAAFSDGSGPSRTGDVTPMTVPEFQAWVAEKTIKEPAGSPELPPSAEMSDAPSEVIPPEQTISLQEAIQRFKLTPYSFGDMQDFVKNWLAAPEFAESAFKTMRESFPTLLDAIGRRIANTPVYLVTAEQMKSIRGYSIPGVYNQVEDAIIIRDDMINSYGGPRVILHEAVHAAFIKAMYMQPEINAAMTHVASEFRNALTAAGNWKNYYAFNNVDEFIAEAFSNISMQRELANTPASAELKNWIVENKMRGVGRPIRTVWDAIRKIVSYALGMRDTQTTNSLLDAIMQITSELDFTLESNPPGALTYDQARDRYQRMTEEIADPNSPWIAGGNELLFSGFGSDNFKKVTDALPESIRPREGESQTRVLALGLRNMDGLAQLAKDFGTKFGAAARKVVNAVERIRVARQELFTESEPFLKHFSDMKRKYTGPVWDHFTEYLHDETVAQTYGDRPLDQQKHLGKDRLASTQAKSQHADLAAEWAKIPQELKNLRNEALRYSEKQQNTMSQEFLNNIIRVSLAPNSKLDFRALAKKIFNKEELTDEEVKDIGGPLAWNHIRRAKELGKLSGPYYPLMRFGEFVVSGKYKFSPPADATTVAGTTNAFEFSGDNARARAVAYAEKQGNPTRVESVWVDPETGERYFEELDEEGTFRQIKAGPKKEGSEQRYRVTVQDQHVEFFDTSRDAQVKAAELKKDQSFTLDALEERRFNPNEFAEGRELMSHEIKQVLDNMEKRQSWEGLTPESKREVQQTLRELSLRMFGTTRVQSRRLKRHKVLGASREFDKVFLQYAQSTAGYIAKLRHQPVLDEGLKELDAMVHDDPEGGTKSWKARRAIANKITSNVVKTRSMAPPNALDVNINRLTTLSFVNYLMSPAYSINNALQVGMLAYPQLAAKYGSGKAARVLLKAYADMGVGRVVKAGAVATGKAARGGPQRTNFLEEALMNIRDTGEREMLKFLQEHGSISPDAGLEMDRMIGARLGDKMLDYAQHIARAMPAAVETINRVTTGLAAYRMEMAKSGDHQKAMFTAQEMVNLTQGNYSSTNMPSFFNHPAGRITFQFKKYGQTVYGMLGHNIGKLMRGTSSSAERAEAAKALALVAATHVVMAGALGLPTEPIRWLVITANLAGLSELKWEDVEHYERQLMASMFGQTAGQLVSRGLPRALGIDVSQRIGMANLMTFGAPRSNDEHSMQAYIGELLAGAPGGMTLQGLSTMNKVFNGEEPILAAAELIPAKIISDSINAYRMATEGRKTAAGYQVVEPTGLMTNMVRAMGYRPAREAEISERRQYFYSVNARVTEKRNSFQRRWKDASPNEKLRLWGEIEQFNRDQPRSARLTRAQLEDYKKRRRGEEVIDGFRITRTNRGLLEALSGIYATD